MVSNASEDLPEPERPVMTVRVFRGISTLMFLRLCWRAPRITSLVRPMGRKHSLQWSLPASGRLAHLRRVPAPSSYTEPKITSHLSREQRTRSRRRGTYNLRKTRASRGAALRFRHTMAVRSRRTYDLREPGDRPSSRQNSCHIVDKEISMSGRSYSHKAFPRPMRLAFPSAKSKAVFFLYRPPVPRTE